MNTVDDLVAGYLTRLENQSLVLPADRRAELLAEIREHISDARAAGAAADEAAVRTLLDRLGEPGEIVAAAQEDVPVGWGNAGPAYGSPGWAVPPPVQGPRGTGLELAAVLLLTAGSFVPVVGWIAGVVLLWMSSLWRVREKLLGTLVVPFGPGAALFVGAVLPFRSEVCTSQSSPVPLPPPGAEPSFVEDTVTCTSSGLPGWAGVLLGLLVLVAPIVVAVVLFRIAQRRAAAGPPVPVGPPDPATTSPWGGLEIAAVLVLGLGFLLPFVGPVIGLVLAWLSPRWTSAQKLVATGLAGLPLLVALSGLLIARTSL